MRPPPHAHALGRRGDILAAFEAAWIVLQTSQFIAHFCATTEPASRPDDQYVIQSGDAVRSMPVRNCARGGRQEATQLKEGIVTGVVGR